MLDLVGNPEDQFSRVAAHLMSLSFSRFSTMVLFLLCRLFRCGRWDHIHCDNICACAHMEKEEESTST